MMITENTSGYVIGPRVTNFICDIEPGTRYGDYIKLANKTGCYAEYYPNNNSIVMEMPNKKAKTIKLADLLQNPEYVKSNYDLPVVLGVDVFGRPVIKDMDKLMHLLVVGKTGTGKTTLLQSLYQSVSHKYKADECSFVILDTKGVDFVNYNNKKNLFCNVIIDVNAVAYKLQEMCEIIDFRRKRFAQFGKQSRQMAIKEMGRIIILVDEFADLMAGHKKEVEKFVQYIVAHGRGVGVHLIMATQRLDKSVITPIIKANFTTRIVFQTHTAQESKFVLGDTGAELLLSYGDALLSSAGRPPIRVHIAQ